MVHYRKEDKTKVKEEGREEDPQQQPCCSSSIFVDDEKGQKQEAAEKTKGGIGRNEQSPARDMSIYPPFSLAALQQDTHQAADLGLFSISGLGRKNFENRN